MLSLWVCPRTVMLVVDIHSHADETSKSMLSQKTIHPPKLFFSCVFFLGPDQGPGTICTLDEYRLASQVCTAMWCREGLRVATGIAENASLIAGSVV